MGLNTFCFSAGASKKACGAEAARERLCSSNLGALHDFEDIRLHCQDQHDACVCDAAFDAATIPVCTPEHVYEPHRVKPHTREHDIHNGDD